MKKRMKKTFSRWVSLRFKKEKKRKEKKSTKIKKKKEDDYKTCSEKVYALSHTVALPPK